MTSTFLIYPSSPTGNNRRIELAGLDLWRMARIDNVFVYPSEINIDRFKDSILVCKRIKVTFIQKYRANIL